MKKRFIVLVDFSEHSQQLISYAYNWAMDAGAELLFIHHSTEPMPGFGDTEIRDALKSSHTDETLAKLRNFVQDITGPLVTADYHVDRYNLSSAIEKLKKDDITDYVFSGIRHKSQMEVLLTGNTATTLAEDLHNIVVAIPESNDTAGLQNLYVAIKPGIALNEQSFQHLLHIRTQATNRIIFLTAVKEDATSDSAREYLEELRAKYSDVADVAVHLLHNNNHRAAIREYVLRHNGVLVVQKGSRNFGDIFRKYFTSGIINDGQVPVVILP